MNRILIGGVVGGFVLFIWGAIAHMALPIGGMGVSSLPQEDTVMAAVRDTATPPGFYFFPGIDMSMKASPEVEAAWTEKFRAGPTGVLVVAPPGNDPMPPSMLVIELLSNIAAAMVGCIILAKIGGAASGRIAAVTLFGLLGWLSTSVSYWNWYKFPTAMICGEAIEQLVGWTLAGFAMTKFVKGPAAS